MSGWTTLPGALPREQTCWPVGMTVGWTCVKMVDTPNTLIRHFCQMLSSQNSFKTLNKVERWIPLDRTFAAVHLLMVTYLIALWAMVGLLSFKVKMPKKKKDKWAQRRIQLSVQTEFCFVTFFSEKATVWDYHVWNYHWNRTKGLLTHWFKTAFLHRCMESGAVRTGKTEPGELCFSHCI